MSNYMDDMAVPADAKSSLADSLKSDKLEGNTVEQTANILSLAGSISLSGGVAGSAAYAENNIHNTVRARIEDSTVASTLSDVIVFRGVRGQDRHPLRGNSARPEDWP